MFIGQLEDLQLVLLPGNPAQLAGQAHSLHNRIFQYWKDFWGDFYRKSGSSETLKADDFMRSHTVLAFVGPRDVVGLMLLSEFDLEYLATADHSYVLKYPPEDLQRLRKEGNSRVLTMEFLTAHPSWRKTQVGISFGELLVGAGMRVFLEGAADAVLGTARVDIKVPELVALYGWKVLRDKLMRHNYEISLVYCPRAEAKEATSPLLQKHLGLFWEARADYRGIYTPADLQSRKRKVA
jgi:hypothetical protein